MASPYGHYAEILEDILKELQKRKRRKKPPNRFHYRINFRSDRRLLGVAYGLIAVTIIAINEQIQNIAQKKDTLCRRMYN